MRRLAALLLILGLVGWAASATGKTGHGFPTCKAFSTTKVSHLLGVGKLYEVSTLAHGRNCTYYGVSKKRASELATTGVPYQKIKYYSSLNISVLQTTRHLFDLQVSLLKRSAHEQGLEFDSVHPKLRFTRDEDFYSGTITSSGEERCDSKIEYDNWVGPPECVGEPALKKIGVIAFVATGGGAGRMVSVLATEEAPPGKLSLSHVLKLAAETDSGHLH